MPGHFFSTSIDKSAIENKINQVKKLLAPVASEQKGKFLLLLATRIGDFEVELENESLNDYEKQEILAQYNRFAKALEHCIQRPERASQAIRYYLKSKYYPVGINDMEKPNIPLQNAALATVITGMALLASAIPAFVFNPALGAILLSVAFTILFPSCFYLMTPQSPDMTKMKEEERELFEEGAKLMKPDLEFYEEQSECPSKSSFAYSF